MFHLNYKKKKHECELNIKVGSNNSSPSFWLKLYNFILSLGTIIALWKYFVLPLL